MIRTILRLNDGLSLGRLYLKPIVRRMQQALKDAGHSLAVDGQFGSVTEEKVKRFQDANGLPSFLALTNLTPSPRFKPHYCHWHSIVGLTTRI